MIALEHIGSGRQKEVYRDTVETDRVVAYYKEKFTNEEAKSAYYLNRLTRALLPDSSIHITASGNLRDGKTFQDSHYVPHDEFHGRVQEFTTGKKSYSAEAVEVMDQELAKRNEDPQLNALIESARAMGLYFDRGALNYVRQSDGSFVNTDFGLGFIGVRDESGNYTGGVLLNFDRKLLTKAIAAIDDPGRKRIAELSYERLIALTDDFLINHRKKV